MISGSSGFNLPRLNSLALHRVLKNLCFLRLLHLCVRKVPAEKYQRHTEYPSQSVMPVGGGVSNLTI